MAKALHVAALVAVLAVPAAAHPSTNARGALSSVEGQQVPAGDFDDQVIITGCVMSAGDRGTSGPRSIIVWSKGDVYLETARVQHRPSEHAAGTPIGTGGTHATVFYWIDDENDFASHVGHRVEIVGELGDTLETGEIEVETDGPVTELEFDAGGREATARVPSGWLGPLTPGKDAEFDIVLRTVDVEKVTVVEPCSR
jgi:hypothetical protein